MDCGSDAVGASVSVKETGQGHYTADERDNLKSPAFPDSVSQEGMSAVEPSLRGLLLLPWNGGKEAKILADKPSAREFTDQCYAPS